jgi:REP element-mobilizing transposase RayT
VTYDSQKHHRRSLRLKGYDYSQAGAYFITVCVEDRACLFGEVIGDQMHLNDAGRMVLAEWNTLPVRFPTVEMDVFGVMPNHIHGIIVVATAGTVARQAPVGATLVVALAPPAPVLGERESGAVARPRATTRVAPTTSPATPDPAPSAPAPPDPLPTLGDIVGAFKSLTTVLYVHGVKQAVWPAFRGQLWQRNYHEHIIRDEESLNRIRQYILDNPAGWASDEENPQVDRPKKKKA